MRGIFFLGLRALQALSFVTDYRSWLDPIDVTGCRI